MKRVSFWGMLGLNLGWVGLSFMWNSLHVILLPAVLINFVSADWKNTILGTLTGLGLIIAMFVQPVAGTLSDGWRSRWGRRRPFILAGTTLDILFLLFLGYAGGIPLLAVGYIGLQICSNFSHGALQGLMPDRLPESQLGQGSSFKTVLDMLGLVIASLAMPHLVAADHANILPGTLIVIAVLVISTAITLFTKEENTQEKPVKKAENANILGSFFKDLKNNPTFARLIAARLIFLLGVYGIQAFAQYYVRDTLPGNNALQVTGNLMAAIVLTLVAFSVISGFFIDRFGTRVFHGLAALLVAAGAIWMAFAHTPAIILVSGSIVGAGIGVFLTANWALANQLAPKDQAGKFMGLTNLATAGAGAGSRLFGGMIDSINLLKPGAYLGYAALFVLTAVFAVAGWILIQKVYPKIISATNEVI